jgi:hypothetical protein
MSVNGVASVDVSLEKGLAVVKLKPGNSATLKQLQEAITKNGFTMKESQIVAVGKLVQGSKGSQMKISGSNDLVNLVPESSTVTPLTAPDSQTFVVEGSLLEATKGKIPDVIRYKSLRGER